MKKTITVRIDEKLLFKIDALIKENNDLAIFDCTKSNIPDRSYFFIKAAQGLIYDLEQS